MVSKINWRLRFGFFLGLAIWLVGVRAADIPLPPGLSAEQIGAARDLLQGKSVAGLKRLTTRKVQDQKNANSDPNQKPEDNKAQRRKLSDEKTTSSTTLSPPPPKVKGNESLIVIFEEDSKVLDKPQRNAKVIESVSTILDTQRIPRRGVYPIDMQGVLHLPNAPAINLKGLTEDEILDRLSVEPLFAGVDILVRLLPIEPVDIDGLKPFGYDLFESDAADFTPAGEVPVPADYVIGPGDTVRLQTYGKMNEEYELEITREGNLPFPNVGSIPVAGLRFKEMKDLLQRRVEKQFLGVNINVSMGTLRSMRVFVLGEVKYPGSYTVSSLATMTHALYASGGVKEIGSLRNVQLKRNGAVIGTLDVYDLLLKGDTSKDLRIQAGDAVFVPPVGATVSVLGEVRRPAIYEFKGDNNLSGLIDMAGGLTSAADIGGVQIERIDTERVKATTDIDYNNLLLRNTKLLSGDVVRVYKVTTALENAVVLTGHVQRPGKYAWHDGIRISEVIGNLSELKRDADPNIVFIKRVNSATQEIELVLQADLNAIWRQPKGPADIQLRPLDEIFVMANNDQRSIILEPLLARLKHETSRHKFARVVRIGGDVHSPGEYPLVDGMKVSDLVRAAGRLKESAYDVAGEITRFEKAEGQHREVLHVSVDLSAVLSGSGKSDLNLQPYDYLVIKRLPLWSEEQQVEIKGEVSFPGKYPIRRGERLSSLIARAGGLTKEAYLEGAVFMREELQKREQQRFNEMAAFLELQVSKLAVQFSGEPNQNRSAESVTMVQQLAEQLRNTRAAGRVVIDLPAVLKNPGHDDLDIVLKNGDALFLPGKMQEVSVMGEVFFATSHLYKDGLSYKDYINMSGGATQLADASRTYVVRANGAVVAGKQGWFSFGADIAPGDTIIVPLEPDRVKPMTLVTGVSQILYQLGVAAAAWKTVGLF
ncbi:MAG: SLBB domain-containing protein [Gammaproteobacteria bacterium]|nr:SLBB domain-containing protein [Gammaproteobacteria bacterium]